MKTEIIIVKKLLILIFTLLPIPLFSQIYSEITTDGWGQGIDYSKPAVADIDNDGLLDLLIGDIYGRLRHYEQSAQGSLSFMLVSRKFNNIDVGNYASPTFTDLDDDGRLDLLIGEGDGNINHYEQSAHGSGSFNLVNRNFNDIDVGAYSVPTFTDLDSDGKLDLLIGEQDGNINHYEQSALSSRLILRTETFNDIDVGAYSAPIITDLDRNGKLDLLIGEKDGNINHYEQSPSSPISVAPFIIKTESFNNIDVGTHSAPIITDLDHDGKRDLLVGELYGYINHFEQTAAGSDRYSCITNNLIKSIDIGSWAKPAVIDLDNNGKLDLLIGEDNGNINHYEQSAAGSESFNLAIGNFNNIDVGKYSAPVFTDLDHNGLLDLLIGEQDGNINHYEQAYPDSGSFNLVIENFNGIDIGAYSAPALTDLDSDGLLDLFIGEEDGNINHYEQASSGSASFTLVEENFNDIDVGTNSTPTCIDLFHDGRLNLLIGENNGNINHYEPFYFDHTSFYLITEIFNGIDWSRCSAPVFTDINGDGFFDLLVGEAEGGVHLYLRHPIDTSITDSMALVALYNSTDGDIWKKNDNWLTGPLDTWYGVTVEEGRVTKLDLHDNYLINSIPPELGNLTELRELILSINGFTGSIPPELGNLINLEELRLNSNQLTGSIPPELGNLTSLTHLELHENQLSGMIPKELGNLINLAYLNLEHNQLSGIPSELGNLINLNYLLLNNNQLTGSIPSELGNLVNLRELILYANQLTNSIPPELGNLINLEELRLNSNQLTGSIPPELGNLKNLEELKLYSNQLTGNIPPELGNLTSLTDLYLSDNLLSGNIPRELGNLTNLLYMYLSMTQLTGSIPPELSNLINLKQLVLIDNQLTGSIPSELGNLTNLEWLTLNGNQLTGGIPAELSNLTNLEILILYENQLTGIIPSELGSMINLEYLHLDRNQLTGPIPPELGNLTSLIHLELHENQLSGMIPPELGSMINLEYLCLNSNQLSGSIPAELTNLTRLEVMEIYSNNFINLPDLSSLQALDYLNIIDNQFTFEDIEPNIGISNFIYAPQDSVGESKDTTVAQCKSLILEISLGGTANQYQWYKNGMEIPGADSSALVIKLIKPADSGSYNCAITNTIAPALTLYSRPIKVHVKSEKSSIDQTGQIQDNFSLYQNYPNPFVSETIIEYNLPEELEVTLCIYNLSGQIVRTFFTHTLQKAGNYTIHWDGTDNSGEKVASGLYLLHIHAGAYTSTKKVYLIK